MRGISILPPTLDARLTAGRLDLPLQGGGDPVRLHLFPPPPGVIGDTPNPDEGEG